MVRDIAVTLAAWLLLSSLAACGQIAPASSPPASSGKTADVVKDFEKRVKQYLDLRTQLAGKSPRPTSSTAKLAESQQQMAARIRAARPQAPPGTIFTPEIAQYFRRQIAATLTGPSGKRIRTSLVHAEPVDGFAPKINEQYPQGVPLQSTPPSLLLNLPHLPQELQYRIIGQDLVLLDTAPNIIVDYISHVLPQS